MVWERSIGRVWSTVGFDSLDEDKQKCGLRIFSIENTSDFEGDDDVDISEEKEECELFESGDPQLL